MLCLDIKSKDYFSEYCSNMVKQLRYDNIPIVIAGDTNQSQYVPFFEKNHLVIDRIYDSDPNKRGVLRNIGKDLKEIIGPDDIPILYSAYNVVIVVPYPSQISA